MPIFLGSFNLKTWTRRLICQGVFQMRSEIFSFQITVFFNVKPPSSSLSPKNSKKSPKFCCVFCVDISYIHRVMICRRVPFVLMALCLPPVTTRQNAHPRAATRGAWVLGFGWDGSRTNLSACLLWGLSNTRTFSAASCYHSWVWYCGLSSYPLSTHVLPNTIYHNFLIPNFGVGNL